MKKIVFYLFLAVVQVFTIYNVNAEDSFVSVNNQHSKSQNIYPSKVFDGVVKIMPLGNSLTFDEYFFDTRPVGIRGGYRKPLFDLLSAAGISFDFVGSEISGQNLFSDPENAGFSGISAAQLAFLLQTGFNQVAGVQETPGFYLDAYMPDIILLEIGTNGFTTSTADLEDVLDEIDNYKSRTGSPTITILAQIINRNPLHNPTSVFNANVATMVSLRADPSLILIDMENDAGLIYTSAPAGDMHDEFHPTDRGYEKMAQLWVDEILRIQELLPDAPLFLSQGITTIADTGPYYYNSHAAAGIKPQYSLNNAPAGMTIDPDYGVVEWTSPLTGNYSFDIAAQNSSGQVTQHIDISVTSTETVGITTVLPNIVSHTNRRAQAVIMPESGVIESISMYHLGGSGQALFGIYDDNSNSPAMKIAEAQTVTVGASDGWQTVPLLNPVEVAAGQKVWLTWVFEIPPVLFYGNGTPGRANSSSNFSGGLPAVFGSSTIADYQYSIYATYTPGTLPAGPPDEPVNLTANAGSSSIILDWQHSLQNTTGFVIERKTGSGPFSVLVTLPTTFLNYIDESVTNYETYTYRVAAFNDNGTSAFSNEATAALTSDPPVSIDVGNVSVLSQIIYNANRRAQQITIPQEGELQSVTMYHGAVNGNVIFAVYNDQTNTPGTLLGITASTPASQSTGWQTINLLNPVPVVSGQKVWLAWVYENAAPVYYDNGTPGRAHSNLTWLAGMPTDFGLASFSNYIYSIYATLSISSGPASPPSTPSNLTAEHTGGSTVSLNWIDNADNETSYTLERMITGGSFGVINTLPANTESVSDAVPLYDTTYIYRIKAMNGAGESEYSNTVNVYVPSPPPTNEAGYHTIFSQVVYSGNRRAQNIIMPEAGIIQQIAMYHGPTSGNLLYAVYTDNDGYPGTRLASTPVTPASGSTDWQIVSLSDPASISAGEPVWLAWVYENPPSLYYDNGGDGRAHSNDTWPEGMPVSYGPSSVSSYRYSIYCVYQPVVENEPPLVPDGLTGNYNAFGPEVELNWNDNSLNESEFVIERAVNGGTFSIYNTLGANSTDYIDSSLAYNNTYQYRVYAANTFGNSGYSNIYELITVEPSSIPLSVGYTSVFDQ